MRTVNDWLRGVSGDRRDPLDCPSWPPDLFAVCGSLLKQSGAYIRIFHRAGIDHQWESAHEPGRLWRKRLDNKKRISRASLRAAIPASVLGIWKKVVAARETRISEILDKPELANDLIALTLIADEASEGIGIEADSTPFLTFAQTALDSNQLTSFTLDVQSDLIGVLAKQHTPQRGATFRSLTHHLALYWPNDVHARWIGPFVRPAEPTARSGSTPTTEDKTLNMLLLPWPTTVDTADFRVSRHSRGKAEPRNGGYFEYWPARRPRIPTLKRRIGKALKQARQHAGHVDAIVFPEASLSVEEYLAVEKLAVAEGAMLIAGVRDKAPPREHGANLCALQAAGLLGGANRKTASSRRASEALTTTIRAVQSKHHRWCLDRHQIQQYQLAGRIPPRNSIWENIVVHERWLHFVTIDDWLTCSVLVCEDLARQDPAADLIRSVGPNLLVTLLMDGPQLRGRWSSRYASVLAEDPGTSVLTLTSLGMAERCRPTLPTNGRRADVCRAIALWRDVDSGEHEIVLDEGDDACLLTLRCQPKTEISADGRTDGQQAHFPIYAGYKSLKIGP